MNRLWFLVSTIPILIWAGQIPAQNGGLSHLVPSRLDSVRIDSVAEIGRGWRGMNKDSAVFYLKTSLKTSQTIGYGVGQIRSSLLLAGVHRDAFELREAVSWYKNGLKVSREEGDLRGEAISMSNLAVTFNDMDEVDSAIRYYQPAIELFEEMGMDRNVAQSKSDYATALNQIGQFGLALKILSEASQASLEFGDTLKHVKTLVRMGNSYESQAKSDSAIHYYLRALDLSELAGLQEGIGAANNNLGNLYQLNKVYGKAEGFLEEALKANRIENDEDGIAITLTNLGTCFFSQGDTAKAMEFFQEGLEIRRRLQLKGRISESLIEIGKVYIALERSEEALDLFEEALEIAQEARAKRTQGLAHLGIGNALFKLRRYHEAVKSLEEGLANGIAQKYNYEIRDGFWSLYKSQKALGNGTAALAALEQHLHYKDSLFNEERLFELGEIERAFEKEKSTREKLELQVENERQANVIARKDSNLFRYRIYLFGSLGLFTLLIVVFLLLMRSRRLRLQSRMSELQQAAIAAQMNPHFVFNAMNCIQRFILKNETEEAYEYLGKFASLIRTVFDHSLREQVPLMSELEMIRNYVDLEKLRLDHELDFTIQVDSSLDEDSEDIPPMIFQPLVENAIWHGLNMLKEPGKLELRFSLKGPKVHIAIEDNGIGRAAAADFKTSTHTSSALNKIEERLRLINGRQFTRDDFKISDLMSGEGNPAGTLVEIQFIRSI